MRNSLGTPARLAHRTDTDPDREIALAMARGDTGALGVLIDRHGLRVRALCRRMMGDEALGEDLAQDVWIKVWKKGHKWSPEAGQFGGWLTRLASRTCLDALRKRREIATDTVPESIDGAPLADRSMIARDARSRVRAAIAGLPGRQRQALALVHFEDLPQKEVADMMETSVEAIESLLARARRALKAQLEDVADGLLESLT